MLYKISFFAGVFFGGWENDAYKNLWKMKEKGPNSDQASTASYKPF